MNMLVVVLLVVSVAHAYTDVDDSFDFEAMVKDPVALRHTMDCFLDIESCSSTMEKFKSHILESVTDGCNECNEIETRHFKVFIEGMRKTYPKGYLAFKSKYDPTGAHFDDLLMKLKRF